MFDWFVKYAPIRAKLLFAFCSVTAATLVAVLIAALLPLAVGLPIGLFITVLVGVFGYACREGIAHSYVTTVVRMEGLAAGDLDSPIEFTDYRDCVGRMTSAMFTFRETAREQLATAKEQMRMVAVFSKELEKLSSADLTAKVDADFTGEFLTLKTHFNEAIEMLRELIFAVQDRAKAISTGSAEISLASGDLARRTEANAASLEETNGAIATMETRLLGTVASADETLKGADGVIRLVSAGRSTARETVRTMERVSESARGIDSVIEGVDKIAFQTRVLAMNAAVEAGRAGEAGRGFAVVADLVSALAMRAEEEAKNARDQLTVTQSEVADAVKAVGAVDAALVQIVEGVDAVHVLLERMAADNRDQSTAISQITVAVNSMNDSTQRNAAMVQETSTTAAHLDAEISELSSQAGKFILA